jgi:hypothetical protein
MVFPVGRFLPQGQVNRFLMVAQPWRCLASLSVDWAQSGALSNTEV